jgi:hypothetical protein
LSILISASRSGVRIDVRSVSAKAWCPPGGELALPPHPASRRTSQSVGIEGLFGVQHVPKCRRPFRQFGDRASVDGRAADHQHNAIEAVEQAESMHGSDDTGLRELFEDPVVDADLGDRVQRTGRLVQQQQGAAGRCQHASRRAPS